MNLINKSESLKAEIRAYASSTNTTRGTLGVNTGVAQYQPAGGERKGQLQIAADKFSTAKSTFNVLAHELGHFRVEEPSEVISNARANAQANGDRQAYEKACNLTEGYAKYSEVVARNELLATNREQADAEGRSLTTAEQQLEDRWTGSRPLRESQDFQIFKSVTESAGAYGQLLTPEQIENAVAFALGESNKGNKTSNTLETYLQYCIRESDRVISSGASAPASSPYAQELLQTTYNPDGTVSGSSVITITDANDQVITTFDTSGSLTRIQNSDGAADNSDYFTSTDIFDSMGNRSSSEIILDDGSRRSAFFNPYEDGTQWSAIETQFDANGRQDWSILTLKDGSTQSSDFDLLNERDDYILSNGVDAQGRLDWLSVVYDNGSNSWTDYDQENLRDDHIWSNLIDAQGREDWQEVTSDDGTRRRTDFDQDGTQQWSAFETGYDAQGSKDWESVKFDDGSQGQRDFDQANQFDYSDRISRVDEQGRMDRERVLFDNGDWEHREFDQTNQFDFNVRSVRSTVILDGQVAWDWSGMMFQGESLAILTDWEEIIYDDGSREWIDEDQLGQYEHSTWSNRVDRQGREDWRDVTFDDGSRERTDFDQANQYDHSVYSERKDSQGRLDWVKVVQDDGRQNVTDYDQAGTQRWSRYESSFDASGRLDASNRYFDDGSRLYVDYDYYGQGKNRLEGFDASGRNVFLAEQVENVVVVAGGRWQPQYGDGFSHNGVMGPGGTSIPSGPGNWPNNPPDWNPAPEGPYVELGPLTPSTP